MRSELSITAEARRRMTPWTRNTFSVVTTIRVRSQRTTAASAIAAATASTAAPATGTGQGSVNRRMPAAARPTARPSGRARTTLWRRASRQTRSSGRIPTQNGFGGGGAIPAARMFGYRRFVERKIELRRNWPAAILAVAAVVLIPWAIALGQILPSRHVADHWDAAWTGFDIVLAASLLLTAYASFRRRDLVRAVAPISGTLLLCDAWF